MDKKKNPLRIIILWYRGIKLHDSATELRAKATCDCHDIMHHREITLQIHRYHMTFSAYKRCTPKKQCLLPTSRRPGKTLIDITWFWFYAYSRQMVLFFFVQGSSIQKRCPYTAVCGTAFAVRKFIAYKSPRTPEYEFFTRTEILLLQYDPWKKEVQPRLLFRNILRNAKLL